MFHKQAPVDISAPNLHQKGTHVSTRIVGVLQSRVSGSM